MEQQMLLGSLLRKVGNGAIANFVSCGRPYCDRGQAVKKLERIRRRTGRPP